MQTAKSDLRDPNNPERSTRKIAAWLLPVLVFVSPWRPRPMLHFVQHPQSPLQRGLAKPFFDPVGDFIQAGLPLVFGFGK